MGDQSNKQLERVKKIVKKAIITALKPIIIIGLIICLIAAFRYRNFKGWKLEQCALC